MKILFYISTLEFGGAERVIANLANQFANDSFSVYLVTTYPKGKEYPLNNNVKRYCLGKKHTDSAKVKSNLSRILSLRKLIKMISPDVVVTFLPEAIFRTLIATIGLSVPVIISVRNDPNKEYASKKYYQAQKLLFPLAKGYVFQTIDARNWFPKRIQKRSAIIINQVDPVFFSCIRKSEDHYVAIGRLTKQKNYHMMIKGFKRFVSDHPCEKLLIYGDGEEKAKIEQLIRDYSLEDNVRLMGKTDNVAEVLSHAKAFVMTSDFEGMPNAMLEAMAVGLPVIVTDCPCGGPRMIIKNNVNGILLPVNDVDSLYNALKRIEQDTEFRKSISIQAMQTSRMFKPQVIYQQWKSYITKVAAECNYSAKSTKK